MPDCQEFKIDCPVCGKSTPYCDVCEECYEKEEAKKSQKLSIDAENAVVE